MILSHFVAALSSFARAVQYAGALNISKAELVPYVKKAVRLALCYAGFATPWNLREAWKAGEAALLSCAYDVVTDWRHFDKKALVAFEGILTDLSGVELRELALTLYDKDLKNRLSEDGLERGAIALRFILKTMGCETQREASWGDLDDLGELLQIVDDVLDYEDDVVAGDLNCLGTANRDAYLARLLEGLSSEKTHRLFGARSVLIFAIGSSRNKGAKLLAKTSADGESEFSGRL
jgi:hypothetical protein